MIIRTIFTGGRRPDIVIKTEAGEPYLLRWHLIPRNRLLNIYLHCFVGDDDVVPHDHPWCSLSVLLKGALVEWRYKSGRLIAGRLRRWGWVKYRGAKYAHRLELPKLPDKNYVTYLETPERPVKLRRPVVPSRPARLEHLGAVEIDFRKGRRALIASNHAWTLFITGPRFRMWGFWCGSKFVPFREFLSEKDGRRTRCE